MKLLRISNPSVFVSCRLFLLNVADGDNDVDVISFLRYQ